MPTPTAQSYGSNCGGSAGRDGQPVRPSLDSMARKALWPTPTVKGNHNKKGLSARSGDGFATAVSRETPAGGPLNPRWVEWLMGWPIGLTGLEPLGTESFRQWRRAHGASSSHALAVTTDTNNEEAAGE